MQTLRSFRAKFISYLVQHFNILASLLEMDTYINIRLLTQYSSLSSSLASSCSKKQLKERERERYLFIHIFNQHEQKANTKKVTKQQRTTPNNPPTFNFQQRGFKIPQPKAWENSWMSLALQNISRFHHEGRYHKVPHKITEWIQIALDLQ